MLSFVKINDAGGIWANKDKALGYLALGFKVYKDETCSEEITEEELNAVEVITGGSLSSSTSQASPFEEALPVGEED
ncbi:MAG: hypothetical protein LUH18_09455 [Oscillospiraceae bacterium]|nr:hypothetical protein [Oscillospiraceae bacterium]